MSLSLEESRYDRQERISWWDQRALLSSRVLVVGAGALGNEIVKNLALVGVGEMCVVDMDHIENANLSRCVFFRPDDTGRHKAEVLALRVMDLNPDTAVTFEVCRIERLGVPFVASFDLVICGLDNRETRVWVNQACRKAGVTWIDGAIEGLNGLVRTFPPTGPCYECTLGEVDRQAMEHRRSCTLLSTAEMMSGRVPTNATTSSIVAGVQVQEAVKALVGRVDLLALCGRAWVFSGESMLTYTVDYTEDEYCMAHDTYETEWSTPVLIDTVADLIADLDDVVAVDFEDDLITLGDCPTCGSPGRTSFRSGLPVGSGTCQRCDEPRRLESRTSLDPGDPLMHAKWADFAPPVTDVISVRIGAERLQFSVDSRKVAP